MEKGMSLQSDEESCNKADEIHSRCLLI